MTPVVRRTGNAGGMASNEFEVTYPDGSKQTFWSPPWHEFTEAEEEAEAQTIANAVWAVKKSTNFVLDDSNKGHVKMCYREMASIADRIEEATHANGNGLVTLTARQAAILLRNCLEAVKVNS